MSQARKNRNGYLSYNRLREKSQLDSLCHAPFNNLLFVQSGDMMTCHYNRGFVLGRYPDCSVKQTWDGNKINALRKSLKDYNPPAGCQFCIDEINNGSFYSAGCKKYDYLASAVSEYPSMMEFQISNLCNLECLMCSGEYSSLIRKNRECGQPYPNPYNPQFADEIASFLPHIKYANFTGGEPFLNDLYYKIWERVPELNPDLKITISTNGTVLNDKVKEVLKNCHAELTISIDSLEKATYEKIRKNASFEEVMSNIEYFLSFSIENKRILSVKYVVMRENIRHIPKLFSYFHDQGVQIYPKLAWVPFEQSLRYSEPEELLDHINFLSSHDFTRSSQIKDFNIERYRETINTLESWRNERLINTEDFLSGLSNDALQARLLKTVNSAIENDIMLDVAGKTELLDHSQTTITELISGEKNEIKRRKLLIRILLLPSFVVINEIYRRNTEKFIQRFR
jgi:sulfatase maturation enzyme AslB (radical SAM superfamily)